MASKRTRVELESILQYLLGVGVLLLPPVDFAQRKIDGWGFGIALQGAAQLVLGFLPLAKIHQERAEKQMSFEKIGINANGFFQVLDSALYVLLFEQRRLAFIIFLLSFGRC